MPLKRQKSSPKNLTNTLDIYTIGHSNHPLEYLVSLLQGYGVQRLIDVRTMPRSRYNPQFNKETLPAMLKVVGIGYTHMPKLGGLRRPNKDSQNLGWKNTSFRGYADYMQSEEFQRALKELLELARKECIAFMCAEAVPWRCHRSLIADALVARKIPVRHIMSRVSAPQHEMTAWSQVRGETVSYPPQQLSLI